jgi:hypothetical protein
MCQHDNTHTNGTRTLYATGTLGLSFELINNNTAYRVRKGTASGAVAIPAPYNGLPVTEIGHFNDGVNNGGFTNCASLTSITIPASVTTIGQNVFVDWTNTQTINVPFANADATPADWNAKWNQSCNAVIKYWNGTTWE